MYFIRKYKNKKNCYIGSGVNIRDHIIINSGILVGMGSLVTKNLKKINQFIMEYLLNM